MKSSGMDNRRDQVLKKAAVSLLAALLVFGPALPARSVPASAAVETDPTGRGAGFSNVLYDNHNGLPTSEANAIAETSDGFIWIGANDSGVALLEDGEFRFYGKNDGLNSVSVRAITEDAKGHILIGTTKGMAYVDPSDLKLYPLYNSQINGEYICELYHGSDDVVYGVTNAGAILTVENLRVTGVYNSVDLGLKSIYSIYPDPEHPGFVYLGSIDKDIYYGEIAKEQAFYETLWFQIGVVVTAVLLVAAVLFFLFRQKTKKLEKKQAENKALIDQMTKVFSNCIDMKDAYTNGHSARVAKYTKLLAEKMGKSKEEVEQYYNIALLHDIGKISIPDAILNKPGRLDDEEYKVMKTHAPRGYEILKDIRIAPDIALGAEYHHERYDGHGYPSGLKGEEIPEVAKIIAVADTFDAMYSTRPYRKKLPLEDVVAEIKRVSGTQLSPEVVDAFLKLVDEGAFNERPEAEPQSAET